MTAATAVTSCSSPIQTSAISRAFRSRRKYAAGRGGPGRGSGKHGAAGDDVELRVAVGTQVFDAEGHLIADLAHPGARAVVCRGGAGGRGNRRFATSTLQTPRFAETGLPGEEAELELHLKLLADAALVGLPNAGKSSLLARISNAKPKIADYPFTTLEPVLGTVDAPDGSQLVVADVPGLIEGAAEGAGLGHEFLAHLERARMLVHVIDAAAGELDDHYATIRAELGSYGAGLDELPEVLVLNKIDLLPEPPAFEPPGRAGGVPALAARPVRASRHSAARSSRSCRRCRRRSRPSPRWPSTSSTGRSRSDRAFRILRTDRGYRVAGAAPGQGELEEALRQAGARSGDEVEVGEETLEYR